MGLLQKACDTYDFHERFAGLMREDHETLAPVSHTLTRTGILCGQSRSTRPSRKYSFR